METISSEKIMSTLREELAQINATVDRQEASVVTEVADGIARISGLKTAMAGELLKLTSSATGLDVYGLVQNLDQDDVGAVLFGDAEDIKEGDECRTTGRVMDIPVGHAMLGRVVNPLGQPIDGLGPINATHRRPIEFKAPGRPRPDQRHAPSSDRVQGPRNHGPSAGVRARPDGSSRH